MLATSEEKMKRKTNVWVLENIITELSLESRVTHAALRYFGLSGLTRMGMENDVMLGG